MLHGKEDPTLSKKTNRSDSGACSSFITVRASLLDALEFSQSVSEVLEISLELYLCVGFQTSRYFIVHGNCPRVSGYCCATFWVHLEDVLG